MVNRPQETLSNSCILCIPLPLSVDSTYNSLLINRIWQRWWDVTSLITYFIQVSFLAYWNEKLTCWPWWSMLLTRTAYKEGQVAWNCRQPLGAEGFHPPTSWCWILPTTTWSWKRIPSLRWAHILHWHLDCVLGNTE